MEEVAKIRQSLASDWIPDIYVNQIRTLRTRSIELEIPERENKTELLETLLGFELKVGSRRIASPNLATARYLQIFARIGCRNIAIPYDITAIPMICNDLERSWERLIQAVESEGRERSPQQLGKLRASLIRLMRDEIKKAGAGELMPLFNRSTKQRKD